MAKPQQTKRKPQRGNQSRLVKIPTEAHRQLKRLAKAGAVGQRTLSAQATLAIAAAYRRAFR